MSTLLSFIVPGIPRYTPAETVQYENLVKLCFRQQAPGTWQPHAGPVQLRIIACFPIPASTSRKNQAAMLTGGIRPLKKPDTDNIGKIIADSLNQIAYRDDSQVVELEVAKFYAENPRVEVRLWFEE